MPGSSVTPTDKLLNSSWHAFVRGWDSTLPRSSQGYSGGQNQGRAMPNRQLRHSILVLEDECLVGCIQIDSASWPEGGKTVSPTIQFTGIDAVSGSCLFPEIEKMSEQACLFAIIRTQHCC